MTTFDRAAFRTALLSRIQNAVDVLVTVSAGSVVVDAVIVMPSLAAAQSAAAVINTTPDSFKAGWFPPGLTLQRSSPAIAESAPVTPLVHHIHAPSTDLLSPEAQVALLVVVALGMVFGFGTLAYCIWRKSKSSQMKRAVILPGKVGPADTTPDVTPRFRFSFEADPEQFRKSMAESTRTRETSFASSDRRHSGAF